MGRSHCTPRHAIHVIRMIRVISFIMVPAVATMVWGLPSGWAQQDRGISTLTVHVIGSSRVRGDDMSASRNEAIAISLVSAVNRVVTDLLPQEAVVGHFQSLNETLFKSTDRFVRDYKVLAESTHAKTYRVLVKATLSVVQIKKALKGAGVRLIQKQYPRVLVCLTEQRIDDLSPLYWWGGEPGLGDAAATPALIQVLTDQGFAVVDPGKSKQTWNYPADLSVTEAVTLAQRLGANLVVVGSAVAEAAPNTMGATIQSFQGTITAQAFRVADAEPIAQIQQASLQAAEDAALGTRAVLKRVAAMAGEDLVQQIAAAWLKKETGGPQMELAVEGIGGHIANFVRFRSALNTMSGVDGVQLKEMMHDTAVLTVDYQGSVRALADALLLQSFHAFGINISEVGLNSIRLQLVPR